MSKRSTQPYTLGSSQSALVVIALVTACCTALIVTYMMLSWSALWTRSGRTIVLVFLVSLLALVAVMTGWAAVRHRRLGPPLYADESVLRLRVEPRRIIELPWEALREVEVDRRAAGVAVSLLPVDPCAAYPPGLRPAWLIAGTRVSRRGDGWLTMPVGPVSSNAGDVASALASLSGGRCPVRAVR